MRQLLARGVRVLVVDTGLQARDDIGEVGARTLQRDTEEPGPINALPMHGASWVVSEVPERSINLTLLHRLEHAHFTGSIALNAHSDDDAEQLVAAGVDVVLRPFHAAADSGVAYLLDDVRTWRGRGVTHAETGTG